jgi:hypothetical protein
MWANCPKQWKLKYVDKLDTKESSIELVFGTAIHEIIQTWLADYFADAQKAKKINLDEMFRDCLMMHFVNESPVVNGKRTPMCGKEILQEFYLDGCEILDHVQKYAKDFFPTKGYTLMGCEIPLELDTSVPGVRFRGFIDLLIHDEKKDEYHIIDLKTSRAGWYSQKTDPKKINQILLYKHFYAKIFNVDPEKIFPKFIILKRKIAENSEFVIRRLSNFEPSHGKPSMKKALTSWDQFLNECFTSAGEYRIDTAVANPSKSNCKYCQFRKTKHCVEGV